MKIKKTVFFFILLTFFSCTHKEIESANDNSFLTLAIEKTDGRVDRDNTIISSPSFTLSFTAKDDAYDVSYFAVDYSIDGHTENIDKVYLDWESHSATVDLMAGIDIDDIYDGQFRLPIEGSVSTVHPETGEPISVSFSDIIWMDTGNRAAYDVFIGTPQGRFPVTGNDFPWEQAETDTLIIKYYPSEVFFVCEGTLVQDDMIEEPMDVSFEERDCDGIVKIPFPVSAGMEGVRVNVAFENSRSKEIVNGHLKVPQFTPKDASSFIGTVWVMDNNPNELISFSEDGARVYTLDSSSHRIRERTRGDFEYKDNVTWVVEDNEIIPPEKDILKELEIRYSGEVHGDRMRVRRKDVYGPMQQESDYNYHRGKTYDISSLLTIYDPEPIDLGIVVNGKSVLWASWNLGATKESEYGNYYAWGEVEPKDVYEWETYAFSKGTATSLTKYCDKTDCGFEGFTDGITTLLPEDDAAQRLLGGKWRIPTSGEFSELILTRYKKNEYVWEDCVPLLDSNGIEVKDIDGNVICGARVTYKANGNSVFFPVTKAFDSYGRRGTNAFYWSACAGDDFGSPSSAWGFYIEYEKGYDGGEEFFNIDVCADFLYRCYAATIRPIMTVEQ